MEEDDRDYKRAGSEILNNKNKFEMDTIGETSAAHNDTSESLTPMNTEINKISRNAERLIQQKSQSMK